MSRKCSAFIVLGLAFLLLFSQLYSVPPSPARAGALQAPQACGGIFFSEYLEGLSYTKAFEIYNGTGAPFTFGPNDRVNSYSNGSSSVNRYMSLASVTIPNGEVYVVAHSQAVAEVKAVADFISPITDYNGNDALELVVGGVTVDVIGQIGFNPGLFWGTEPVTTMNHVLRRKASVSHGDPIGSDPFDPIFEWEASTYDDFTGLGAHTADCIGGGDSVPVVTSVLPANMTTGVPYFANLEVTFSEPVDVAAPWFDITCTVSGVHPAIVTGGPQVFTLDPYTDFVSGDVCAAKILAAQVSDQDGMPDNMAVDYSWQFITDLRIHHLQGAAHLSPFNNWSVQNIPGIVTRLTSSGFYMQDDIPDTDDRTSEAIYIYLASAPAVKVGDRVWVSGKVSEYYPGGISTGNLSTTELTNPTISVLASDVPLPLPTVIGAGGRVPPNQVIEDDSAGNVELQTSFDPSSDGMDFYESLESMLVQVNNARVVGGTDYYSSSNDQQIVVVGDQGMFASGLSPRGGVVVRPGDFNPERIFLEAKAPNFPEVDVGALASGPIIGVMDYTYGNFKLFPNLPLPGFTPSSLAYEVSPLIASIGQLRVATLNVENLDPAPGDGDDDWAKFQGLAIRVVHHLHSPEIIGLQEIQDNSGATNDGVVSASATYAALIQAIQNAGGPRYEYREISPVNNQDGGQTGGNIRVAFLFRTDRGVSFVDRPGGTASLATTVQDIGGEPALAFSPGRIDPTNSAFANSRKPLAGEFMYNGVKLFLIVNHLNSKGEDGSLFGRTQPPVLGSESQRIAQAQVINNFVDSLLALDPNANVVVLGDLNDYQFSTPLQVLMGEDDGSQVLTAALNLLPDVERYTYLYQGNLQALDHILLSNNLMSTAGPVVDVVHFNAEFREAAKVSDHDSVMVGLNLLPLGTADFGDLPVQYGQAWHTPTGIHLGGLVTNDAAFSSGSDNASDDGVTRGLGSAVGGQWQAGPEGGSLEVTPSGPGAGYLYAWIDWNSDGDFEDAGENVIQEALIEEPTHLPFAIPDGVFAGAASAPTLHVRIRFYDDHPGPVVSPVGAGASGEVEDYIWTFTPTAVTLASLSASSSVHPAAAAWMGGLAALGLLLLGGLFLALRAQQGQRYDPARG